jgi:hypothetical protein
MDFAEVDLSKGIQFTDERAIVELQHINIKLPLKNAEGIELGALIHVFHSWIQDQVCDELLLDVADYRHVPDGPGVVVIGHEADYAIDNTDGRLGVRYNRKAVLGGSNQDRLGQAMRSALRAAQRLEEDTSEGQKLTIDGQEIEILINDRLLAPNRDETRSAVEPELRAFLDKVLPGETFTLAFNTDPRKLLTASIRLSSKFSPSELLDKLAEPRIP